MKTAAKRETTNTIEKFIESKATLPVSLVPSNAVKTIINVVDKKLFCITSPEKRKTITIHIWEEKDPKFENSVVLTLPIPYLLWQTSLVLNRKLSIIGEVTVNEINYKNKETVEFRPWHFPNVYSDSGQLCFGNYTPTDLRKAYNNFLNSPFNLELTEDRQLDSESSLEGILEQLEEDDECDDPDLKLTKKERSELVKSYNSEFKTLKKDLETYYKEESPYAEWTDDPNYFGYRDDESESDYEGEDDPSYIVFGECDGIFLSESKLIPDNFKTNGTATGWIKHVDENTWSVTIYKNKSNQVTFKLPASRLSF